MKEAPVTPKTRKGMTLTIDDRKFIKVQNDFIIEMLTEKMDDNLKFVAEIVIASTNKMFTYMEEIREELKCIKDVLDDHEIRIRRLEDCFTKKSA